MIGLFIVKMLIKHKNTMEGVMTTSYTTTNDNAIMLGRVAIDGWLQLKWIADSIVDGLHWELWIEDTSCIMCRHG